MRNKIKYETPEFDITSFQIERKIMDFSGDGGDGDIIDDGFFESGRENEGDLGDFDDIFNNL